MFNVAALPALWLAENLWCWISHCPQLMCDVQHCPGHAAASARPGHATASAWPRGRGFVAVLLFFLCRLQGEAPEDSQDVSFPETGVVRSMY